MLADHLDRHECGDHHAHERDADRRRRAGLLRESPGQSGSPPRDAQATGTRVRAYTAIQHATTSAATIACTTGVNRAG